MTTTRIAPQPNRKRSVRRTIGVLLGSTFIGCLIGEFGMRTVMRAKGDPYDSAALLEELERYLDTVKAFTPKAHGQQNWIPAGRVLHPYFGSENGPDPGGVLHHFQNTEPDAVVEVLVVGGSVSMLFCRDAGAELEEAIAKDPRFVDQEVRVLHGGHAAYKQPQQLNKVTYLFAHGYRPDLVINLDGFNEVANGFNNGISGTNPLFPTPPVWAGLLWGRSDVEAKQAKGGAKLAQLGSRYRELLNKAKRFGLLKSAIGGSWVQGQLRSLQTQRAELQELLITQDKPISRRILRSKSRELNGDTYDRDETAIMDLSVKNWFECSLSLHAICQARGIPYLHILQPTLWDPGAKLITKSEQKLSGARGWRQGVELGYPQLRESVPELKAANVAFLDLSMSFQEVDETLYIDPCHFKPRGSKMLVDEVAAAVLAQLP